jgi:hypothetical protein
MNEQTIAVAAKASAPDRDQVRGQLQSARDAFTTFVRSLSADDWEHASPNPAWNVRQLMYHTAWSCEQLAANIPAAKSGKAKGALVPHVLINPASMLITKWGARGATPSSVCALYERGHAAVTHALDGIRDDEWHLGAKSYGTYSTIEDTFATIVSHASEHIAEVRQGLGR